MNIYLSLKKENAELGILSTRMILFNTMYVNMYVERVMSHFTPLPLLFCIPE